jgi:antitoxin CcdA
MAEVATKPRGMRQAITLASDAELVARARAITPNLSATLETLLEDFVAQADTRRRADDAALDQVIQALNAHHVRHG